VAVLRGKVRGMADRVLSSGKYLALLACMYLFWFMHNPRWAVPIRTGGFIESTMLTFEHAFPLWLVRTGIVLGALAMGLVIPHFWCRFLCPTGAAVGLVGFRPLFRYSMTRDCTDCGVCNRTCDLETRPSLSNCTNCGDCAGKCPVGAIRLGR
jgi:polyferredoxin